MKSVTKTSVAALAAGALMALAGSAGAQQTLPPPASPPMAEAPVDPEQLALARHLMSLMSSQMDFGAVMKNMIEGMMQTARQQNPNLDPAAMDRIQAAIEKAMAGIIPDMLDDVAKLYARQLTRKEMEDTIAFYEGPSGQAVLHKMPEIFKNVGPLMAKYIPRMQTSMIEALCAQNACTAEQRKALTSQVLMSHGG